MIDQKNLQAIKFDASGSASDIDCHDSIISFLLIDKNDIIVNFTKNNKNIRVFFRNYIDYNLNNINSDFIVSEFLKFNIDEIPLENDKSIGLYSLYLSRSKFSDLEIMKERIVDKGGGMLFFNIVSILGESVAILCHDVFQEIF